MPSPLSRERVLDALKSVRYPGFSRDIVSFGLVKGVECDAAGRVSVGLTLTTADPQIPAQLEAAAKTAIQAIPGVTQVDLSITLGRAPAPETQNQKTSLAQVRHIIAVASGKGGVGKSTVAVNLACAFQRHFEKTRGLSESVGLMDCDIYGPSVPQMLGLNTRPEVRDEQILPLSGFGVRAMSMGFFIEEDTPVAWRGPMINKTIQQFASHVDWGTLEMLVVDLPPGTGDAQLTLAQTLPLNGALIVTTPQSVAVNVARRGAMLFEKVNVPLLGVVENMSYLNAPDGSRQYPFGQDGGTRVAEALQTRLLAQIPLEVDLRIGGDQGLPLVVADPEHPVSLLFLTIASDILQILQSK